MMFVAGENLLPILVALLIGFVTGLWIWKFARSTRDTPTRVLTEDAPLRRPYVENRPAPAPEPLYSERASPRPEPEVLARRAGRDVADSDVVSGAAAAIEDVADQFLGIDAHPGSQATGGGADAVHDDLQVMKGVGPKLASLLRAEGLTRFDQIAALTPDDLARLDTHLGAFKGRLVRDRIVEQAAFLAVGDRAGYERAFGKL
ncbi:MAG TPA: hypothetical protein VEZ48_13580 [Sphingomonadaceae bacterium]|jgi:predicted flap endonuclease-1-like 5' DNA nuclease|nr:hypothetical protein [Sphingomonadaceae bacterium]